MRKEGMLTTDQISARVPRTEAVATSPAFSTLQLRRWTDYLNLGERWRLCSGCGRAWASQRVQDMDRAGGRAGGSCTAHLYRSSAVYRGSMPKCQVSVPMTQLAAATARNAKRQPSSPNGCLAPAGSRSSPCPRQALDALDSKGQPPLHQCTQGLPPSVNFPRLALAQSSTAIRTA